MTKTEPVKAYHHGDLKNALVAVGQVLLSEGGMAQVNLREVARRAGVSHAAPYRHFKDKEALLAAIAEDGFRQLAVRTRQAVATVQGAAREKLIAAGQAYVQFALDQPSLFLLMFSAAVSDRAQYPALSSASKLTFHQVMALIVEGQARGEFVQILPDKLTITVWSLVHGQAMLLLDHQIAAGDVDETGEAGSVLSRVEFHLRTLLSGLRNPAFFI